MMVAVWMVSSKCPAFSQAMPHRMTKDKRKGFVHAAADRKHLPDFERRYGVSV